MTDAFTKVTILPHYALGFIFSWDVSQEIMDKGPWKFVVEEAPAKDGPWTPVSPELANTHHWIETTRRVVNKNQVLLFRVKLITGVRTYYSAVREPYSDLNRREYLIAREIMRREVLHARTLAGGLARVWLRSTFGPQCTVCKDPVTGDVINTACQVCFGTGRNPGFYGPFDLWFVPTPTQRDTVMAPDGTGTREPIVNTFKTIGFPHMKDGDILIDKQAGKRYYVDSVSQAVELRGYPLVQQLEGREIPVSDPVYNLFSQTESKV